MKFWLPVRAEMKGMHAETTDDPKRIAELVKRGARITMGVLRLPNIGSGLKIKSAYFTSDRTEAAALMKVGGILRFDPQEAIDEGLFTAGEVKAMGFDVEVPEDEPVKEPEVVKPSVAPPDFDTMSKAALVDWADSQDPPIHLDRRKRKDLLAKEVRELLAERNK